MSDNIKKNSHNGKELEFVNSQFHEQSARPQCNSSNDERFASQPAAPRPRFDAPPWNSKVRICGNNAERAEERCREMGGDWQWITNGALYQTIIDNFEQPLPVQQKVCAAINEGMDVLMRIPCTYGRTTAWMVSVLNKVVNGPRREPGVLRHIVVTKNERVASRIATQLNLLVPRDNRDIRMVEPMWYWSINKRFDTYSELRNKGCDIMITTLGGLLDLLKDPPFDTTKLETITLDDFDGIKEEKDGSWEGTRWWIQRVKSFFGQNTQTIVVGRSGKEYHDGRDILRPYSVTIDATSVKEDFIPRHDFLSAFSSIEEEQELCRSINMLREERDNCPIAIFFPTDIRAESMMVRLIDNGFNRVGILIRNPDEREEWRKTLGLFRLGKIDILLTNYDVERMTDIPGQVDVYVGLPAKLDMFTWRVTRNGRVRTGRSVTILNADNLQDIPFIKKELGRDASIQLREIEQDMVARNYQLKHRSEVVDDLRRHREEIGRLEERQTRIDNEMDAAAELRRQRNIRAFD